MSQTSVHENLSRTGLPQGTDMRSNLDFSAPVIHFGTSREVAPRQSSKDQHFIRSQEDRLQTALAPISKENKLLTLFIGGLPKEMDDSWTERILKARRNSKRSAAR